VFILCCSFFNWWMRALVVLGLVFTARRYASAVYAMALCLSVTSQCSTKTAKHRITQTKPHDSPGTLTNPLQVVTYTVKVVVGLSKKWCQIDMLLLHTTDRKYHIAYWFWPFPVTVDDIEVIRLLQDLSNAIRRKFVRYLKIFRTISTDIACRAVPRR